MTRQQDGNKCLVAPGSSRCWAASSSDTAPVLIALGASVRLAGPGGERVTSARALYRILGVAVALRLAEDGTCADARIVLGAVEACPVEAQQAASMLIGQKLTSEVIAAAARAAARPARPLDNTGMSCRFAKRWRRSMWPGLWSRRQHEARFYE